MCPPSSVVPSLLTAPLLLLGVTACVFKCSPIRLPNRPKLKGRLLLCSRRKLRMTNLLGPCLRKPPIVLSSLLSM